MQSHINFDKPDFAVKLPTENKPQYLMLLMHGYGSDGQDLIGLSNFFDQILPDTVYLSPNAPTSTGFGGFQWFPLSDLSNRELETGTLSIAPYVHDFIDQALEYYKIDPKNLIIAGFSQGAMLALHVSLERTIAPSAVLAYSGALTAVAGIKERIKSKPPILLCHGGDDTVVRPEYSDKAYDILLDLGVNVQKHIIAGYPHTIPPEGLQESIKFLSKTLK